MAVWIPDRRLHLLGHSQDLTTRRGRALRRPEAESDFRLRFADRVHRALFNEGAFTTDQAVQRYEQILSEVEQAMVAESARWGDMHASNPHTPLDWAEEADSVINTFIRPRAAILLDHFRSDGLYPSFDAPAFNQHGGDVPPGFELTMSASNGNIYFTTDGSDPRSVTGEPVGTLYNSSYSIDGDVTIKARVFLGGNWSALNEAQFSSSTILGDFNSDQSLNCQDADLLSAAIAAGADNPEFDLTGDGLVNAADMSSWLAIAGNLNLASGDSYLQGDANLDGLVDVSDFNIWNSNKFTSTSAWCSGDFTLDGVVDASDFYVWNGNKFSIALALLPGNALEGDEEVSDARDRLIDLIFHDVESANDR